MFQKVSHINGLVEEQEILFSTRFDYFFPEAARSSPCLLPTSESTLEALRKLADEMADPGESPPAGDPITEFDSDNPAILTYFGQFIDHDITARTDRDGNVTSIGKGELILPLEPDQVIRLLRNGRRPTLDLDSVFGDGPGLVSGQEAIEGSMSVTQSQILYEQDNLKLSIFEDKSGGTARFDLIRSTDVDKAIDEDGKLVEKIMYPATIADGRNDENVIISQLQTAFIKFYNAIYNASTEDGPKRKYIRARQLATWAYQFVVVNDYLCKVCDPAVVEDTLVNGPRFIGASAGRGSAFMPLEFSTAAFRFGHSMIRPFYKLNNLSGNVNIMNLLGTNGNPDNFGGLEMGDPKQLVAERVIDWNNFVGSDPQKARKIDSKISKGLFDLSLGDRRSDPVLKHLARSNLFRGYNLSIPTGQAMCDAFGIRPMTAKQIRSGQGEETATLLENSYLDQRTPLFYYILREAAFQQGGQRLGELGSRIVSETIINLLKQDPNSYLNNVHVQSVVSDPSGEITGITVASGPNGTIQSLEDILAFAGVL